MHLNIQHEHFKPFVVHCPNLASLDKSVIVLYIILPESFMYSQFA